MVIPHPFVILRLAVAVAGLSSLVPLPANASTKSNYLPTTTNRLDIPTDHLRWLVKPLTHDELLVESGAWQKILRKKVEDIVPAEITVKVQNTVIKWG